MKHRAEFPRVLIEMGLTGSAVEVGVDNGEFASHMLKYWPGRYYMVDRWPIAQCRGRRWTYLMISKVISCMQNVKPYEDRAFMLRMPSIEAARVFQDESLDFVYIDADHSYEAVRADINAWYPKVKPGGILAGHDYLNVDFASPIPGKIGYRVDEHNIMVYQLNQSTKTIIATGRYGTNPAVDEFIESTGLELHVSEESMFRSWHVVK